MTREAVALLRRCGALADADAPRSRGGRPDGRRSLGKGHSGGLILFGRLGDSVIPCEVEATATVADLKHAVRTGGVSGTVFTIHFSGQVLDDDAALLADVGLGAEAQFEIRTQQHKFGWAGSLREDVACGGEGKSSPMDVAEDGQSAWNGAPQNGNRWIDVLPPVFVSQGAQRCRLLIDASDGWSHYAGVRRGETAETVVTSIMNSKALIDMTLNGRDLNITVAATDDAWQPLEGRQIVDKVLPSEWDGEAVQFGVYTYKHRCTVRFAERQQPLVDPD
eukprot:TRINITY_DN18384_c0_g1_i1.p1 TRINITY_DN18384_c0_g1~~TRINITY_DN18384_c0_g1_i1.p1  ORF type:complete len:304 (+),score=65.96 TRINITY_DN18384_c0_g1_i1:80-913(+)